MQRIEGSAEFVAFSLHGKSRNRGEMAITARLRSLRAAAGAVGVAKSTADAAGRARRRAAGRGRRAVDGGRGSGIREFAGFDGERTRSPA